MHIFISAPIRIRIGPMRLVTCVHFSEDSYFTCCVVVYLIVFKFTLVEIMIVFSCSPIFPLTLIMTVGQLKASSVSLSVDVNGH